MKITKAWLDKNNACAAGRRWLEAQDERDSIKVLRKLQAEKQWDWFRWTAARSMTHKQKVLWSCACAEMVLEIFEKKYPDDKRPRLAIDAARKWAKNPTKENKDAATDAATDAAYAAYAAAYAANDAATDAYSAYAAAYAADAANAAATDATDAAGEEMRNRCADEACKLLSK